MVGVLVLVNEHVAEAASIMLCHLRVPLEDTHHFADEVVKIHGVGAAQLRLIIGVDLGHHHLELVAGFLRLGGSILRRDQLILQIGNSRGQGTRSELFQIQLHILGNLREQSPGIVRIIDGKISVQAGDHTRMLTQDPYTRRVESGHPHAFCNRTHHIHDTFPHFRSGFIRKCDRQNLARMHPTVLQQIRDPAGQYRCFPRAGTCHDQQRHTGMLHSFFLLRIQPRSEITRIFHSDY